jgi:hypothetical protein
MNQFDNRYAENGYSHVPAVLSAGQVGRLAAVIDARTGISPGDRRLLDHRWCRELLPKIRGRLECDKMVPSGYVAVLCTFFDKSGTTNWSVAPHRDTSIPVAKKFAKPGWHNWTTKQGIPHVQPPPDFLYEVFALRLHIDHCDSANGALLIAPGSHAHRSDQVADTAIEGNAGDGLLMSPLLRHASKKSTTGEPRRVLHYLFAPSKTDAPLSWYYAVA